MFIVFVCLVVNFLFLIYFMMMMCLFMLYLLINCGIMILGLGNDFVVLLFLL